MMLSVIPSHPGQPSEVPDEFGQPLDITPDAAQMAALAPQVVDALRTVFDPEIPVNIYELGLIYAIDVSDAGNVKVEMTLTAPGCPSAQELPEQVRDAILAVPGVATCDVDVVWDPPWDPRTMASEEVKMMLGIW